MSNFHGDERRKAYRVELESPRLLEVSLVLPAGEPLPGDLVNLSINGAAASFLTRKLPGFAPNDKAKLKFATPLSEKTLIVDAIVKGSTVAGRRRICRFQFPDPHSLFLDLDPLFSRYFNCRQFSRTESNGAVHGEITSEREGA